MAQITTSFNDTVEGSGFEEKLPFNVKNIEIEDKEYLEKLIINAQGLITILTRSGPIRIN